MRLHCSRQGHPAPNIVREIFEAGLLTLGSSSPAGLPGTNPVAGVAGDSPITVAGAVPGFQSMATGHRIPFSCPLPCGNGQPRSTMNYTEDGEHCTKIAVSLRIGIASSHWWVFIECHRRRDAPCFKQPSLTTHNRIFVTKTSPFRDITATFFRQAEGAWRPTCWWSRTSRRSWN